MDCCNHETGQLLREAQLTSFLLMNEDFLFSSDFS